MTSVDDMLAVAVEYLRPPPSANRGQGRSCAAYRWARGNMRRLSVVRGHLGALSG